MAAKVIIIADDLTGALDCAAAFAVRGLSVIAARRPQEFEDALASGADIVAVSTGTRESDPETANAVLSEITQKLSNYTGIILKKIDSRMQGNVRVEIEALAGLRPGPALVCPAIPRLGRFVRDGAIVGAGVDSPIAIAPVLGGLAVNVIDAQTDADIDLAVGKTSNMQLYVGAAGLAEALARRIAPTSAAPTILELATPALLAIGSRDPVTTGQVDALEAAGLPLIITKAPNGKLAGIGKTDGISVVQMILGEDEIPSLKAAGNFATGVASIVASTQPKTLFVCGGESANAILGSLGIGLLEVTGEVLPGVPCATARDGVPGLTIITKSGGFGEQRTLIDLCAALLKG